MHRATVHSKGYGEREKRGAGSSCPTVIRARRGCFRYPVALSKTQRGSAGGHYLPIEPNKGNKTWRVITPLSLLPPPSQARIQSGEDGWPAVDYMSPLHDAADARLVIKDVRVHNRAPQNLSEQNSAEYLDNIENEWIKRVDTEIETLVDGMVDLVSLASVRAANSLLAITHSLKLLLLLSEEQQISQKRDAELKVIREQKAEARKECAALLNELLNGPR
ncbi:hypothetical protein BDZ89DRAFT_1051276 [Hymenopellis radicata]|nr:hypothetical protein BDZ89DRAFT_1051276 [Hymenopellis radicata]